MLKLKSTLRPWELVSTSSSFPGNSRLTLVLEMACKQEACIDCRQKCLLFHGQRENMASSFFKVMFGDQFTNILFFPPKVARIVSPLIGKESVLEDSSGMQWEVRVSRKENLYALEEGWSAFASEHGLDLGDFLVFHYIRDSHFLVQVYDKSSCQKLDFSAYSRRKKAECERDSNGKKTEMEKPRCETKVVSRKDPNLNPDEEFNKKLKEHMKAVADQLKSTVRTKEVGINAGAEVGKGCCQSNVSLVTQKEAGLDVGESATVVKLDAPDFEIIAETAKIQGREKLSKVDTGNSWLNIVPSHRFKSPNLGTVRNSGQISHSTSKVSLNSEKLGKELQKLKVEQVQNSHVPIGAHDKTLRAVKPVKNAISPLVASFTCLIRGLKPFLELPAPLPVRFQKGESSSHGFTVVYLQDPLMRVWPVVYHHNPACGLRVLGSGWETIRKANNIQPGDECLFETRSAGIPQVRINITRKLRIKAS